MNRTKTVPVLVSALTHINGCGGEILRRTGKRPKPPDTKIGIKSGKERKTEPSEEKNQKNRKFPAKNSSFRKICLYLQSQNESFGEGKAEKQPRNTRRDAGVVDRAALEMRCTGNCTGGSNPSLSATNAENQQIAKQTPSFAPKNVKSGVFVLFKIIQPLHNKRVAILKESDEKRLIFIYPFTLIFQDFTSS